MENYRLLEHDCLLKDVILKEVDITGNICGEFVEFSRSEVYENVGENDVQVEYIFPIPDTSVLTGFEANIGGRILKAKVESKLKAQKFYEDAESKGIPTLTLDRVSENVFKISLGRIMRSEKVTIKVTVMDQLTYEDGSLKLIIPTVITPIHNGNNGEESIDSLEEEEINYESYLNLIVEPLNKIDIKSDTHNIDVEWDYDNNIGKVSFASNKENLNKDFVLDFIEKNDEEASGMFYSFEEDEEEKAILYLSLRPDLPEDKNPASKKYVFVLDASESMRGEKFEQAKSALQMCIRNLRAGDRFNIIAFGNKLSSISEDGSLAYNDENLKKATSFLEELEPEEEITSDTIIFEAVKKALSQGKEGDYCTILLFTDDEVENEEEILNYVRIHIEDNRIFTFAVDTNANSYFINKLAERGYGKAEFIYSDDERIDDKVLRQFNRIVNPQVDIEKIDWGTMTVEKTYPRTIDYLYDMEPFAIFAKVSGDLEGKVTIKGKVNNEPYDITIDLDKLDLEENADLIQKVWIRKRIESIEAKLKGERGNIAEAMKNKIVELSKEYEIISKETSFIMNEVIEEPVLGMPIINLIPISISEETLMDISEGYLLESPTLLYKDYKKVNFKAKKDDVIDDWNIIDRGTILRIIAQNQYADGSFSDENIVNLSDKIEVTLAALLAFTLGKENVNNYANQITKAVKFIADLLENDVDALDDRLYALSIITFRSVLNKKVMKDKEEEFVKDLMLRTIDILKDKKCEKALKILKKVQEMSIKDVLLAILDVNEIRDDFKDRVKGKNPKECISDYAKLAMIKAIDK